MSFYNNHIFIFIIIIFFSNVYCEYLLLMNEECKRQITIEDNTNFLMETLRGKIPLKLENTLLNQSDLNLIEKLNFNISCPYIIKDTNDISNTTIGVFLGLGINLLNYSYSDILANIRRKEHRTAFMKYLRLIRDIENSTTIDENLLKEYTNPFKDIEIFNTIMINYTMTKFMNKTNNLNKYNNLLTNSVISIYLQKLISDEDLQSNLTQLNINDFSYIIEHYKEFFPNQRLIQSKLISFFDAKFKYNFNHVFFIIEKKIFNQIELDNINSAIKTIYDKLNNNRISILIKNEDKYIYLIDYKKEKDNLDELLKTDNKSETMFNISEVYFNINKKYEENKKEYFENKIAILFLNYETNIIEKESVEKYLKENNIQTIPVINIANTDNETILKDIFEYNIFHNFTYNIDIQYILTAINNMHVYLNMEKSSQIKLEKIKLNDENIPIYFQINIDEKKEEKEFYEISLEINNSSEYTGYNIFISNSNPYPNIRNNLNYFMKYSNNLNPKIYIKSENITKNNFYIGIEGKIFFDLKINKKIYEKEIKPSEGEYDYINYNATFESKLNKVLKGSETFGNNYNLKSEIFNNETEQNMMKYFTRGIDIDNTNDYSYSFFNYNLFVYLYSDYLINRIYKDKNNEYYMGINNNLKNYSPMQLKKEGFNRFTINKLYPFLNSSPKLKGNAPSVYFDDIELQKIFNITFEIDIKDLKTKINKNPLCTPFEQQTPTKKFILFCIYFYHYRDPSIIKVINYISMKNPDYSSAISLLKEKYSDNNFLVNFVKQLEQEDKSEKILTSIIMGKSLILSNIGLNFISEYYNVMSKSMTKTSISIYDTLNNQIKNIIPFSSNTNQKIEEINKTFIDESRDNYNNKQLMDFYSIIEYGNKQFKNYDRGIKKKIIIICDENIKDGKYIINNELQIDSKNFNKINLGLNQIDLILITTKNYEKGEMHELFKLSKESNNPNLTTYSIYENYFHVSNLNNTGKYMTDLNRLIKGSSISIKLGMRLLNDYYQEKNSYFKINCSQYHQDSIVIKTNVSNYNFYASLTNPFPYYSDNDLIQITSNAAVIKGCHNGYAFLGLSPKLDTRKEIIEIFSCESYNSVSQKDCKSIRDNKKLWILFGVLVVLFIFGFTIYKCIYSFSTKLNKKHKKRLNVFDTVK